VAPRIHILAERRLIPPFRTSERISRVDKISTLLTELREEIILPFEYLALRVMMPSHISRRNLMRKLYVFAVLMLVGFGSYSHADDCLRKMGRISARGQSESLIVTPPQTTGPFYPGYEKFRSTSTDLTNGGKATGEVIQIIGRVLDRNGTPIEGAEVHVWQTDGKTGMYNHPVDPKYDPKNRDPGFSYWGRDTTKAEGSYAFRTVRPIEYPASDDWMRPDHVHFSVYINGERVLDTQMYFLGDEWIPQDKILNNLTPEQRNAVIVDFSGADRTGIFDIVLDLDQK
jgi:protocatechuate 3,4-dioxygenase, beta subunit